MVGWWDVRTMFSVGKTTQIVRTQRGYPRASAKVEGHKRRFEERSTSRENISDSSHGGWQRWHPKTKLIGTDGLMMMTTTTMMMMIIEYMGMSFTGHLFRPDVY